MNMKESLSIEEVSNIFCMEVNEFEELINSRDFNIETIKKNGKHYFPYHEVEKHLQSQYFI